MPGHLVGQAHPSPIRADSAAGLRAASPENLRGRCRSWGLYASPIREDIEPSRAYKPGVRRNPILSYRTPAFGRRPGRCEGALLAALIRASFVPHSCAQLAPLILPFGTFYTTESGSFYHPG